MKRRVLLVTLLTTTTLFAQQKAPGNETITEAELRADLFFVASDASDIDTADELSRG